MIMSHKMQLLLKELQEPTLQTQPHTFLPFQSQVLFFRMQKLSIITPCSRPVNLKRIAESIQFDKIDRWYIVYDTSPLFSKGENTSKQRTYEKQFLDNPKVSELECPVNSGWGNAQRNLAIGLVTDGLVYFLDDDNIIHEAFWQELPSFDLDHLYSFDRYHCNKQIVVQGGRLQEKFIDTAQYIVPRRLIGDLVWDIHYGCGSDGRFVEDLQRLHGSKHVYVPKVLAYYNYLRA